MTYSNYILTLSCKDTRGIVAAVAQFLSDHQGFIMESTQFGDPGTARFFMRVQFQAPLAVADADEFRVQFHAEVAQPFAMEWQLAESSVRPRVAILVSRQLHCLNDLLHRYRTGSLAMEIPAVISNHEDARGIVEWSGIPFHHFPTTPDNKPEVEKKIRDVLARETIDLVVLARYMQILSPELSRDLRGRAINIHHSFLPSFKGAKPYHQAYERGVKIIGATAHYVTDALDEGPIIDQEVERVNHAHSPQMLAAIGEDIEARVLSRTVKYWLERRILLNGNKTVVFH